MEIPRSLYSWMHHLFTKPLSIGSDTVLLSLSDTETLKTGVFIGTLLTKKFLGGRQDLKLVLKKLKNEATAGTRLQNWTILAQVLARLGCTLSKEAKSQIVNDSVPAIVALLEQLKDFEQHRSAKSSAAPNKPTCLDFFVETLITHFGISQAQAMGLLASQSACLRQLLTEGVHADYSKATAWLTAVASQTSQLTAIISAEAEALPHVLYAFRGGLESADTVVFEVTLQLYRELGKALTDFSSELSEWFLESGVYGPLLRSLHVSRNTQLISELIVLYAGSKLEVLLLQTIPEEFAESLELTLRLLEYSTGDTRRVLEQQITRIFRRTLKKSPTIAFASFLCSVWKEVPTLINSSNSLAALNFVGTAFKTSSELSKVLICGQLLIIFQQTAFLPIFEFLLNVFYERFACEHLREILLASFANVTREKELSLLVEKLVLSLQSLDYSTANVAEALMFRKLAKHPHLQLERAVLLLDSLCQAYFSAPQQFLLLSIEAFLRRYISHASVQQYCVRLLSSIASLIVSSFAKQDFPSTLLEALSIVTPLIVELGQTQLNKDLLGVCLNFNRQVEQVLGHKHPLVQEILAVFGDSQTLITAYEATETQVQLATKSSRRARASASLQKVRLMKRQKQDEMSQLQEVRSQFEQKQKSSVRKMRDLQRVVLGLDTHFRQVSPAVLAKMSSLQEVTLSNIEEESEFDQELIFIVLKRYAKAASVLFNDYSRCKDPAAQSSEPVIRVAEVCRLLREHQVTAEMITTETLKRLYALLLIHFKATALNYEGYLNFLYQVALKVFTVSPRDLSHFPSAIALKALFETFGQAGLYPPHYFTPTYPGDPEVLQSLNKQLLINKDAVLPQGYKRITEKIITIQYALPFSVATSLAVSLEVLDELLNHLFRVHILEPIIEVHTVHRAVEVQQPVILTKASKGSLILTPNIKAAVSKLSSVYTEGILIECAKTLDDLLHSVSTHSHKLETRNLKPTGINHAVALQQQREAQTARTQELSEFRRKRRAVKLAELLKDRKEELNRKKTERILVHRRKYTPEAVPQTNRMTRSRTLSQQLIPQDTHLKKLQEFELQFDAAVHDSAVAALGQEYLEAYSTVIAAYSNSVFLSASQCTAFAKDSKFVPELIAAVAFNRLVGQLLRTGYIGAAKLHLLLVKLAVFSRRKLEQELEQELTTFPEMYRGLLQYLGLPKAQRELQRWLVHLRREL